jgi:hypothetical protein
MTRVADALQRFDLCWLRIDLEFLEACRLSEGFSLQLRRELQVIARELLSPSLFKRLFSPPLPTDPEALRRFQRPAPGFVLKTGLALQQEHAEGDEYSLQVVFCGDGIQLLEPFMTLLRALAHAGLHRGAGRCEPIRILSRNSGGSFVTLWERGQRQTPLMPPLLVASWFTESRLAETGCRLTFVTPARLLSHGKPLFHPDFAEIFPFMLRRVGAMFYHWGGVEFDIDPARLLAAARQITVRNERLHWQDWRILERGGHIEELGGLLGNMELRGEGLAEIAWIVQLAQLFHIGRYAAYGSGEFAIIPPSV